MARDYADIERDIERARNQLASTLDELVDRTSPKNLATDAKDQALSALQQPKVQAGAGAIVAVIVGLVAFLIFKKK